jgi:hypothetical protein
VEQRLDESVFAEAGRLQGEPDRCSLSQFTNAGQSMVSRASQRFSHDLKQQASAIGLLCAT